MPLCGNIYFGESAGSAWHIDHRLLMKERNLVRDLVCVPNSGQNSAGCFHRGSAELMRSSWKRTRTAAQRGRLQWQNGGREVKNGPKKRTADAKTKPK